MADSEGKKIGNISLPTRLQPPDIQKDDYLFSEEHKVMIMNMQNAFYGVKIADLETRIKRLEDRNKYILNECTTKDLEIKSKDQETADNIAEINRTISQEMKKIEVDNEEVEKVVELRLLNKKEHDKKMELIKEKYEKTRSTLVSEMKILNARSNTLEDFKTTKEVLVEKLEENNKLMEKNEENIKWALEQINRKFKIEREKMKNDLYDRLLNMANDFQIEITEGLSLPVHRLIRENIAIQDELTRIFNESVSKQANSDEMKLSKETYHNQIEENRKQTFRQIITSKIQACLLTALKTSYSKMKKRLADSKLFSQYSKTDQEQFSEELKMEEKKRDFRRRQLEVKLHRTQIKVNSALSKKQQSRYRIKKLQHILYDVKFAASCALKLFGSDKEIEKMTYKQLLSYLMKKLENESDTWIAPKNSIETIFPIDIAYQIGDLGFDPVDSKSEIITLKETEITLQSGLQFFEHDTKNLAIPDTSQTEPEQKVIPIQSIENLESLDDSKISIFDDEDEEEEIESVEERENETDFEDEIEQGTEKEEFE